MGARRRALLGLAVLLLGLPAAAETTVPRRQPPTREPLVSEPPTLDDGSTLLRLPGGQLLIERTVKKERPALWRAGLITFSVTYATNMVASNWYSLTKNRLFALGMFPVVGPIAEAIVAPEAVVRVMFVLNGLLQAGGLFAFAFGRHGGPRRVEKIPVVFTPVVTSGGGGVSIAGRL